MVGGSTFGGFLSDEHRYLCLDGIGVLGLVYEQVGVAIPEVVSRLQVVAQQVPRPYQEIVIAGATAALVLPGVLEHKFAERAKRRHESVLSRLPDLSAGVRVQVGQRVLQQLAGVHSSAWIGLPVGLPSPTVLQRQYPGQHTVCRSRPRIHFGQSLDGTEFALDMIEQTVLIPQVGVRAQPLEFIGGFRDGLHCRGWWERGVPEDNPIQEVVVPVEPERDILEIVHRQAQRESEGQRLFQLGTDSIAVEGRFDPCRPRFVEGDVARYGVHRLEQGGKSGLYRTLAEDGAGEAVKRLYGGVVEVLDALGAEFTFNIRQFLVFG